MNDQVYACHTATMVSRAFVLRCMSPWTQRTAGLFALCDFSFGLYSLILEKNLSVLIQSFPNSLFSFTFQMKRNEKRSQR